MRKLFFLVLLFITFNSFAQSLLTQRLDFSVSESSPTIALQQLAKQSGITISFSTNFFKRQSKKLSFSVKNQTIEHILNQILQSSGIAYKVLNNKILLYKVKLKKATISGYLKDEDTGERLIGATIYCSSLQTGAITNEYGFYSLTLPTGEIQLQFSYLGCKKVVKTLQLEADLHQDIALKASIALKEVVVKPESEELMFISNNKSEGTQLLEDFVMASPTLGGEPDYVRAAQLLPGVQSGVDGLGGIQVRGGESGHHLMLLDGVPVYIPYHLLGAFSIYNASTVQSAKLFKGMIPARYGGRLSSFFDVRTREGNQYKWHAEAGISLLNGKVLVEGPLKKAQEDGHGGSSMLLAGRYSPQVDLLSPIIDETFFEHSYGNLNSTFYDLNLKLNYSLSKKDRFYLSLFIGYDQFYKAFQEEEEDYFANTEYTYSWGNIISSFRWNHLYSKKLFANYTFTFSYFNYYYSGLELFFNDLDDDDEDNDEFDLYFTDNRSENKDFGLKADFDYLPTPKQSVQFGFGLNARELIPVFTFLDEEDEELEDLLEGEISIDDIDNLIVYEGDFVVEADAYVETQLELSDTWQLDAGLRTSFFQNQKQSFFNLEPRLLINKQLAKSHVYGSVSRMVQYLHLVSNTALKFPNDLWVPASEGILPQKAWQLELGWAFQPSESLHLTFEAYHNTMQNLYAYPEGEAFLDNVNEVDPEDYLLRGEGRSYGLESLLKYDGKEHGFMFSYTLSNTQRRFDGQNLESWYPHDFDQRHRIKLFAYQKIGKHFQLGVNWVYFSGSPKLNLLEPTLGSGFSYIDLNPVGEKNSIRSTPYHRIDFSVSYQKVGKKLSHRFTFGSYNAYNQQNIAFYEITETNTGFNSRPKSFIPFIPSFSYSIKL